MTFSPKTRSGQRIQFSADFINRLIDIANLDLENLGKPTTNSTNNIIQVINETGEAVPANGIMALKDSLIEPDTDDYEEGRFRSVKPQFTTEMAEKNEHDRMLCIALDTIDVDAAGRALVYGVVPVKVNMIEEDHKYATIITGGNVEKLESASVGPVQILWVDAGTGDKWALGLLDPMGGIIAGKDSTIPRFEIGGSDETEAAETTVWDIEDQAADEGLIFTMLTRIAYDHEGDSILYGYYRDLIYDLWGRLIEITEETRVIIDTPENC
jgi:hypothetical protein